MGNSKSEDPKAKNYKRIPGLYLFLFDLILYIPVNNFLVMLGWVLLSKPVLSKDLCVLLKDRMQWPQ